MLFNYHANKNHEKLMQDMKQESRRFDVEYENLIKKYQEQPDTLIRDYDETIKMGLIGIIANFRTNRVFRDDIIANVNTLIRLREFIINQYGDSGSSNN